MGRDDWYRRTTWTERDQSEFAARNAKSRGADRKAQYIRIQAQTLLETGKRDLIDAARVLLEQHLCDYPEAWDRAFALATAGRCCESLGDVDAAINFYRRAIEREREFPGVTSNACFDFAKLVVEHQRVDLLDAARDAVEGDAAVFPVQLFVRHGVLAAVAESDGNLETARDHARRALAAADVSDTGLGHGRGHLGTVTERHTRFLLKMKDIADG